jgi:hypothetical protein
MKLRFRQNSLRLRVNQREVDELASGIALEEDVSFPGNSRMRYILEPYGQHTAAASFEGGVIRVSAPGNDVKQWANSEAIGMYFDLPADGSVLRVAIEKDLECVDGPPEERDPDAFPRSDRAC